MGVEAKGDLVVGAERAKLIAAGGGAKLTLRKIAP